MTGEHPRTVPQEGAPFERARLTAAGLLAPHCSQDLEEGSRASSASRGWGLLAGALRQHRQGLQSLSQRFDQEPVTKPLQNHRQGSVLTLPLKEGEGSCAAERLPILPKHLPQHPPPSGTSPISLLGSQSYSGAGPRSARCDRHFKACAGTYCSSCSAALGRSSDSFLPSPRKAQ